MTWKVRRVPVWSLVTGLETYRMFPLNVQLIKELIWLDTGLQTGVPDIDGTPVFHSGKKT